MKFWLALHFEPLGSLLDHARAAEALGFDGVVLPEHLVVKVGERTPHPNRYPLQPEELFPDPLLAFAAMAAVTTKLKFLNGVYVAPLRDPFMLAKQTGTLSLLSNGRFVFGAGAGWLKEEFETVGQDFASRGARMDEMLAILRDFWEDGYAEHHGVHYDFPLSGMFPPPEHPIPIWIGGHSTAAARRAAGQDGYLPMRAMRDPMGPLPEQSLAEFQLIDRLRAERGLTGPFERMVTAVALDENPAAVRKLEEADGVGSVLVNPWPQSDYSLSFAQKRDLAARFAERVIQR